jgi:hypothetical protein
MATAICGVLADTDWANGRVARWITTPGEESLVGVGAVTRRLGELAKGALAVLCELLDHATAAIKVLLYARYVCLIFAARFDVVGDSLSDLLCYWNLVKVRQSLKRPKVVHGDSHRHGSGSSDLRHMTLS